MNRNNNKNVEKDENQKDLKKLEFSKNFGKKGKNKSNNWNIKEDLLCFIILFQESNLKR